MIVWSININSSRIGLAYDLLQVKHILPKDEFDKFIEITKNGECKELTLIDDALENIRSYEESLKESLM